MQSAIENFNQERKSLLQKAVDFFKRETVLVIALLLAVVSMFFVKPDGEYSSYIDYQTLALLFSLMIIMAKFQRMGLFHFVGVKLLEKVSGSRQIYAALVLLGGRRSLCHCGTLR